jgi:transcriptional regulator with XRE-family HTH domain
MPERGSPTVRRRRLGYELRQLREATRKTGEEAAAALGWSDSKISRIETGRIAVTWGDVSDMLDLYGVTDPEIRGSLIALAREARQKGWWHPYSSMLSRHYATHIGLEAAAESLRIFEPLTVPGLLQTEPYARAIIATNTRELGQDEIERRVEVRLRRQDVIFKSEDPLRLSVVLDEAVLRRETGGPAIMTGQIQRLIEASAQPRIRLQVLAFAQGSHVGMAGSFGIFSFPGDPGGDIGFVDTMAGSLFVERRAEITATRDAFDELSAQALSREDTLVLLTEISAAYLRRCQNEQ